MKEGLASILNTEGKMEFQGAYWSPVCLHICLVLALGRQRPVDLCDFEACLVCILSSRSDRAQSKQTKN